MSVVAVPEIGAPVDARARGRRLPVISLGIIATFVVVAILAPLISPADPYEQSLRLRHRPPAWEERGSWAYPLGTDQIARASRRGADGEPGGTVGGGRYTHGG